MEKGIVKVKTFEQNLPRAYYRFMLNPADILVMRRFRFVSMEYPTRVRSLYNTIQSPPQSMGHTRGLQWEDWV